MPAQKKTVKKATKKPTVKAVAKAGKKKAAKRKGRHGRPVIKARPRKESTGRPKGGAQPGSGRPLFSPTDDDRRRVEVLASLMPQEEIAALVFHPKTGKAISNKTLQRHFSEELQFGKNRTDARIGESLVQRALDVKHPQGFQSARFYLTVRAGWTETTRLEVDGKAGVLVVPAGVASVEKWLEKVSESNDGKPEPGGDS